MSHGDDKGGFDLAGMLGGLLGQAQEMQSRMEAARKRVSGKSVEGQSGGGVVRVVMTGDFEARSVRILPLAFQSGDVTLLEDLVTAAVNDAVRRVREVAEAETAGVTSGLDLGALGEALGGSDAPRGPLPGEPGEE